jgi:YidC/Oxa1 family membrane protein insertase
MFALVLTACAIVVPEWAKASEDIVSVATAKLDLAFSARGANPVRWRACHPSCAATDSGKGTSVRFAGVGDPPPVRLLLRGGDRPVDLDGLPFAAEIGNDARTVTFRANLPVDGVRLEKSFELSPEGYEVAISVRFSGPNAASFLKDQQLELEISPGRSFYPAPGAGFAPMLERVSGAVVTEAGAQTVDDRRDPIRLGPRDWAGQRSRFWAIVGFSETGGVVDPRSITAMVIRLGEPPLERREWRCTLYSGPVEQSALDRAAPALDRMLLSGLWSWLRALALGLSWLLNRLSVIVGSPGVGVVGLAVLVKLLLLPLTALAERLQEQVNATQARLEPQMAAVRTAYRGEERTRRTLALYREEGVHPLYTLKSLIGVLIQLPVFIAVFDMLAEDFGLNGVRFLWIPDLSRPDSFAQLPVCLPFFGCDLNVLPFLMAGVSFVVLLRFRAMALTPTLVRRQRRNLAGMNTLFFLLFYTFPAGMVLYWTSTNAFQLASEEARRLWRGRNGSRAPDDDPRGHA